MFENYSDIDHEILNITICDLESYKKPISHLPWSFCSSLRRRKYKQKGISSLYLYLWFIHCGIHKVMRNNISKPPLAQSVNREFKTD